jgi:hypothetical protein
VKRSMSRDRDSVKSKKPGATTAGSERDLIPWHLAKRFEDRDKALARTLKPVHAVGAEALESEIAAEDFGDALRWQAGRAPRYWSTRSSSSVSKTATPLCARIDVAVIPDLVDAKEPLTTEGTRA